MTIKKSILIQVIVIDQATNLQITREIQIYDSDIGWELERLFTRLGEKYAKEIDPAFESNY